MHTWQIVFIALLLLNTGCSKKEAVAETVFSVTPAATIQTEQTISEDTRCDDKDCVAYYLYSYHHLPDNYMTKEEARTYGWESGALNQVVEGMCIGGDSFGNYEEVLPVDDIYFECDIDTMSAQKRGVKRIVYSDDWDIYYTDDHYETFELLYGES